MKANSKERWISIDVGQGSTEVHLKTGQFIFGRDSAARELKMKPSSVWKRMQKLKSMGNLNIQSNRHYSIITICNWESYQHVQDEKEQPKQQSGDSQGTAREQPGDTNNNVFNVKNDFNNRYSQQANNNQEARGPRDGRRKVPLDEMDAKEVVWRLQDKFDFSDRDEKALLYIACYYTERRINHAVAAMQDKIDSGETIRNKIAYFTACVKKGAIPPE